MDFHSPPHGSHVGTRLEGVLFSRTQLLGTDNSKMGAVAPMPLSVEVLLDDYVHLLEEHFEPYQLRGKLLEFESLSQAGAGCSSAFMRAKRPLLIGRE